MIYVHYNMEFYQDFTRQMLGIILKDTLKEKNDLYNKTIEGAYRNGIIKLKKVMARAKRIIK